MARLNNISTALIPVLNQLGVDITKEIPDINNGGCCVFAAIVGEELAKKRIPIRFAVADVPDPDCLFEQPFDLVRKAITCNTLGNWNYHGVYFGHVFVEFDYNRNSYYYDTDGVIHATNVPPRSCDDYEIYVDRLTLDEVRELAACQQGWNTKFNRRYIPSMRKLIKRHISVVDLR